MAGDCAKLSLLLELDSSSGGKMKEALTDEMIEVAIYVLWDHIIMIRSCMHIKH